MSCNILSRIVDFLHKDAKLGLKVLDYGTMVVQDKKSQKNRSWETIYCKVHTI